MATATAAAAAAMTTATAAARAFLGFVNTQRTTAHVETVQRRNGFLSIRARHFHEAESAWAAGFTVIDERYRFHRTVLLKEPTDSSFVSRERQITNINFSHTNKHSLNSRSLLEVVRTKQSTIIPTSHELRMSLWTPV